MPSWRGLVFEVPATEIDEVRRIVMDTMTQAANTVLVGLVPVEVEPVVGQTRAKTWGQPCEWTAHAKFSRNRRRGYHELSEAESSPISTASARPMVTCPRGGSLHQAQGEKAKPLLAAPPKISSHN